jgi:hypothetical protein
MSELAISDWMLAMAKAKVPYQARLLAITAAVFQVSDNATLCALTGMSLKTLNTWKAHLRDEGWVALTSNHGGKGTAFSIRPSMGGGVVTFTDVTPTRVGNSYLAQSDVDCVTLTQPKVTISKEKSPHTPLKENNIYLGESQNPTTSSAQQAQPKVVAALNKRRLSGPEIADLNQKILAAANGSVGNGQTQNLLNLSIPIMWVENGADLDRDVLPTIKRLAHGRQITNWAYFTKAIAEAKDIRERGLPPVALTRQDDFAERRKQDEIRKMKAIVGDRPLITGFRDE